MPAAGHGTSPTHTHSAAPGTPPAAPRTPPVAPGTPQQPQGHPQQPQGHRQQSGCHQTDPEGSRSRGSQLSYVGNYLIRAQNERATGKCKQTMLQNGRAQITGISPIRGNKPLPSAARKRPGHRRPPTFSCSRCRRSRGAGDAECLAWERPPSLRKSRLEGEAQRTWGLSPAREEWIPWVAAVCKGRIGPCSLVRGSAGSQLPPCLQAGSGS